MRPLRVKAAWPAIKGSLITIYKDVYDEHLFVFAAGLSYYFVLSLFPLLVSMASLLGYIPIPHLFEGLLGLMARLVPGDGMSLVRKIVSDVVSHKHTHFLTLGLVFTIWTVSSGFAAIMDGLNVVYRVRETRPVWRTRPIALGLTLLAGSLLLVAVGLMVEGTHFGIWFTGRFNLNPAILAAWRYFRWSIAIAFAVLAVELLYHFGPNMKQRFRDSLIGAIVAVTTWIGLSYVLGSYFRNFDNLDVTYGALGAAIGLYVWFYLSGFAVLIGGEINFLLGQRRDHRILQSSSARTQINNLDAAA
ncbi:MAG TPA: YihY/virulence factor BrkB family protein [Terriglobales bacterium]|jgi:membrane protein|nr:YihY/virulence factor BrkB family protein [Terriglobales bacterium]